MAENRASFVWYELMTTDTGASEAFYRAVVGWTAKAYEGMDYTVFSAGERGVGGMMALSKEARAAGARPGWIGYIAVPDVDAAAAKVREAGGAVHRAPDDIPGVGRFAPVSDPQGAAFILFKPMPMEAPQSPPAPMTPGHVGWHELHTSNWEEAIRFYSSQFGWSKAEAIDMGPMGTYQLFSIDGPAIGGMMNDSDPKLSPGWLYYFNVGELDAALARVTSNGGVVQGGPEQVPGGAWVAQVADPQGAVFALVAPRR